MGAETFAPETVDAIVRKNGGTSANLILMLQDIQTEYRYLPHDALLYLSDKLNVPVARVYHVATFYKAFSLKPKGRHEFHVCMGTACHVRGSKLILDQIARELDLPPGGTSKDLKFSLDTVNCLGSCALGPLVVVDHEYVGHASLQKMKRIVANLKKKED
jgi:NADH-quinone oxidoreductase subunit E